MNITWYGHSCFKLQGKDVTLVTDPFDKETGLKPPSGSADIVTISNENPDHNNREAIKGEPFLVDGAGEYEIKGVSMRGIESYRGGDKKEANTIFLITLEDIRFCHLGDLGQKSLETEQLKAIGDVDVLFIPVGGGATIGSNEAEAIIGQIDPRIVVPMHYKMASAKGDLAKLEDIKNFSQEHNLGETVSKLTLKKKDLPEEDMQYVVMDLGK